eukprot:921878-Amphidinium_carterae.1
MANPADDGRSVSSRNVPILVASSSNTSNTSTLPRIMDLQAPPIGRERERAIQLIPKGTHPEPPNTDHCVTRPTIVERIG